MEIEESEIKEIWELFNDVVPAIDGTVIKYGLHEIDCKTEQLAKLFIASLDQLDQYFVMKEKLEPLTALAQNDQISQIIKEVFKNV